jgi:hypothetical protein
MGLLAPQASFQPHWDWAASRRGPPGRQGLPAWDCLACQPGPPGVIPLSLTHWDWLASRAPQGSFQPHSVTGIGLPAGPPRGLSSLTPSLGLACQPGPPGVIPLSLTHWDWLASRAPQGSFHSASLTGIGLPAGPPTQGSFQPHSLGLACQPGRLQRTEGRRAGRASADLASHVRAMEWRGRAPAPPGNVTCNVTWLRHSLGSGGGGPPHPPAMSGEAVIGRWRT